MARSGLRLPCSVFTFHYLTYEKVIVTIDRSEKFYKARKWYLAKAKSTEDMPPNEESTLVDEEAVFDSDFTVMPEFKVVPYQDNQYRQRSHIDPTSLSQESEFHNLHTQFANTQKHKVYRRQWLWTAFVAAHGALSKTFNRRWDKWVEFFDLDRAAGEVSPDLIFAQSYDAKNGHLKESKVAKNYVEATADQYDNLIPPPNYANSWQQYIHGGNYTVTYT